MSLTKVLPEMITDLGDITGIIETNSTFVDFQVFGPALDPVKDWHVKLGSSVATELMLVTVEDTGADTDVTIWDLTDSNLVGGTPLATVTLTGAATPTSVAAAMGYIIVGSEDGISIIDPHDGAWAERTEGWPKSLSTSTTPDLPVNDVVKVAADFSDTPRYDPRTKGPMPTFACGYGSGTDNNSIIKDDGNVFDSVDTTVPSDGIAFINGRLAFTRAGDRVSATPPISRVISDSTNTVLDNIINAGGIDFGGYPDTKITYANNLLAGASSDQLVFTWGVGFTDTKSELNVRINRTRNTGWMIGDVRGAWLANSKTIDHTFKSNTLAEVGTVTEAAVETGAELLGYSGFSSSNALERTSDADFNAVGTGAMTIMCWFKSSGAGTEWLMGFADAATGIALEFGFLLLSDGTVQIRDDGATAEVTLVSSIAGTDDGNWHMVVGIRKSSTEREIWIDGVFAGIENSTDAGSLTGTVDFGIGRRPGSDSLEADTCTIALARMTATIPTAAQIRHMYETERRMFEANAKCLLQSGTTDAVLDVQIDPITNKVSVTQTDDEVTFDGLVIDDEPTIPSGGTTWEHVARYGDDRFVITDANLYANLAAKNLRQEFEANRGKDLPKGPDLSTAKAWLVVDTNGPTILQSHNVASITKIAAGEIKAFYEVPFKGDNNPVVATAFVHTTRLIETEKTHMRVQTRDGSSQQAETALLVMIAYGELENE